jgi:hypothetical protein
MYNFNGLAQLTNFQLAVIFGAITTFATGVLLYAWKVKGDSLFNNVKNDAVDVGSDCTSVINKTYYN